jgi:hypothetical protein
MGNQALTVGLWGSATNLRQPARPFARISRDGLAALALLGVVGAMSVPTAAAAAERHNNSHKPSAKGGASLGRVTPNASRSSGITALSAIPGKSRPADTILALCGHWNARVPTDRGTSILAGAGSRAF